MEMCYRSRGTSNYLEIELGKCETLHETGTYYHIRMIEENDISCLLQPVSTEIDGRIYLRYDVGTQYVVGRYLRECKLTGDMLALWLGQIVDCIYEMEKFLLSSDNLVLDSEYIFYSPVTQRLNLIYVPNYEQAVTTQLKLLLEYFMQRFDASDRSGIQLLYKIHDYVSDRHCDINGIRDILGEQYSKINDIYRNDKTENNKSHLYSETSGKKNEYKDKKGAGEQCVKKGMTNDTEHGAYRDGKYAAKEIAFCDRHGISMMRLILISVNVLAAGYELIRYIQNKEQKISLIAAAGLGIVLVIHIICCVTGGAEDMDEAMEEYGRLHTDTDIDTEPKEDYKPITDSRDIQRLVPLSNGALEEIKLSGTVLPCIVGRGRRESTYRLPTTQISRVHASIYRKDGVYYIEDRHSTNGTYVNSVRITAGKPTQLNKGDIVGFANEDFFVS